MLHLISRTFFSRHYKHAQTFYKDHFILGLTTHWGEGFGIALLLQHYLQGDAFLPPAVGWILVAISVTVHVIAFLK
jgi:hypothetical protein